MFFKFFQCLKMQQHHTMAENGINQVCTCMCTQLLQYWAKEVSLTVPIASMKGNHLLLEVLLKLSTAFLTDQKVVGGNVKKYEHS